VVDPSYNRTSSRIAARTPSVPAVIAQLLRDQRAGPAMGRVNL